MSDSTHRYRSAFRPVLLTSLLGAACFTGCVADPTGLSSGQQAGAAGVSGFPSAGSGDTPAAGSTQISDGGGTQGGAADEAHAGSATGGSETGGGETGGTGGGVAEAGAADQGGSGSGGSPNAHIAPTCAFHTVAGLGAGGVGSGGGSGSGSGGGGGAGGGGSGGAGPVSTVSLQVSPFLGNYLADSAGRTLYTYGADLPGDCTTPPVSLCITDCLTSWPLFPAGARVVAPGLDEAAFGAILRADGAWQTTYYGWPLYYYKLDLTLGQVSGQGKSKIWHIAQQKAPGVVIMKAGTVKYLADRSGHTLYVSSADQVGVSDTDPVSTCSGSCLSTFEPFHETNFSVVGSLLPSDFGAFVAGGALQIAYKGMPLYRAATDLKSGDMTGTAVAGFSAALP